MPHRKQSDILMNFIGLKHQPVALTLLNGKTPLIATNKRPDGLMHHHQTLMDSNRIGIRNPSGELRGIELGFSMLGMKPFHCNADYRQTSPEIEASLSTISPENNKNENPDIILKPMYSQDSTLKPFLVPKSNLTLDYPCRREISEGAGEGLSMGVPMGMLSTTVGVLNKCGKQSDCCTEFK